MSLQNIPLDRITLTDLTALKESAVRESRTIDYKRSWQLSDDGQKKEFLADFASFANAGGGDIVYGISEAAGVPDEIVGLTGFDFDKELQRAQSLLASWIDPRVAGASFRLIEKTPGSPVFVVRVPRSWNGPHMVTYNGYNRFFSRNANGKYEMDVREIKDAFLSASGRSTRLRDFRLDRISRIAVGDVGVRLASTYAVAVHLLPLAELAIFDYTKILTLQQEHFWPISGHGFTPRINFEGCMFASELPSGDVYSYLQVFRDGAIEAVATDPRGQETTFISQGYESDIRERIPQLMSGLVELGVGPPFVLGLTHVNAFGMTMYVDPFSMRDGARAIDRQHLMVPEAVVADLATPIDAILKPMFDVVWNACGIRSSLNYSREGTWTGDEGR